MCRQGIPDYLIDARAGDVAERVKHTAEDYPVSKWQRVASPVWMDIDPSDTLQYASAREHDDERHICPLQLGSYPARRGALDESRRHCSIAVRGDRQRRICDAANGAPLRRRGTQGELLPAGGPEPRNGNARDGRHVRNVMPANHPRNTSRVLPDEARPRTLWRLWTSTPYANALSMNIRGPASSADAIRMISPNAAHRQPPRYRPTSRPSRLVWRVLGESPSRPGSVQPAGEGGPQWRRAWVKPAMNDLQPAIVRVAHQLAITIPRFRCQLSACPVRNKNGTRASACQVIVARLFRHARQSCSSAFCHRIALRAR